MRKSMQHAWLIHDSAKPKRRKGKRARQQAERKKELADGIQEKINRKLEFADMLRNHMTPAESALWERLQYVPGWSAQVVLCGWIVDFYNSGRKCAVEVDGSIHNQAWQIKRDNDKDKALFAQGIRVFRFTNREVLEDPVLVIQKIWDYSHAG